MITMDLHVIFGHGQVGRLLTARLAADGHRVRVVTRSRPHDLPADVEHRAADLRREPDATAAARGATVIYHVAGAPYADWPTALPRIADAAVAAAAAESAPLIYVDNLYRVGAPTGPITETTPSAPIEAKGRLRAGLAERLLDAARQGTVPGVAIAHASDFFGPGVHAAVAHALVFAALAAGRTPRWPVTLDQPHSMTYTPDAARTLAALGTRARAAQAGAQRWLIPADGAPSGCEFIRAVAAAYGRTDVRGAAIPGVMLRLGGLVKPEARDLAKLAHQFDRPWILDGTRTSAELGVRATPLREAVAETVDGDSHRRPVPDDHPK